jgi:hypothetical protein
LQAGGEVRGLPERQLFLAGAAPHLSYHDQPGMDPEAYGEVPPHSGSRRVLSGKYEEHSA